MKYYYPENIRRYAWASGSDTGAWADIEVYGNPHCEDFDEFSSRRFLEAALPRLRFDVPQPEVFEYGCGTGAMACFLASHGFRVHAIDLIPEAIEVSRKAAAERGLDIQFEVADVCDLSPGAHQYDLVVDGFCLQHIVFDVERTRLFSSVRARLKPDGYYFVTAVPLDREHEEPIGTRIVEDPATGIVYTEYDETDLIDVKTGTVLRAFEADPDEYPEARVIEGRTFLPYRRYLRPAGLAEELEKAGFSVVFQDHQYPEGLVCSLSRPTADRSDRSCSFP